MSGLLKYYPHPPNNQTHDDWEKWFQSPETFEFPNETRLFNDFVVLGFQDQVRWYLQMRSCELNENIERLVMFRALPQFKKEITGRSRMSVGCVTTQVWTWWLNEKSCECVPDTNKKTKFKLPIHDGQWEAHYKHYVGWYGDKLPKLVTDHWWLLKWSNLDGVMFRSKIRDLTLVRNTWNGIVTVEFSYLLWKLDDDTLEWEHQ